tara:strand:+ start:1476 stop:3209 length:1734 start_codon:yes stop_codon:yes gene_type:complete
MIKSIKKIKFLLNKNQIKSLVILSLLLVIGMIFEVFGLGIIIPFITIILNPEFLTSSVYSNQIRDVFGEIPYNDFLFYSLSIFVVIYLFKTLFLIFLAFKQNTFLSNLDATVSVKLFNHYLKKKYSFHLKRNSASLIKNLQVEVNLFRSFCMALITLIIESALLFSIIITLILIEPIGALTVGLFFIFFSLLVIKISNKSLKFWGMEREIFDDKLSKNIVEGLGGIKEILILRRNKFFTNIFSKNHFIRSNIIRNHMTISQAPRYLLEIIAVIGIIGFIFIMLKQSKDTNELLTILGVFVAATFRMIPSFNRIIVAFQNMKYYSSSVDLLFNEFKNDNILLENKNSNPIKFKSNISINNLEFSYSKNSRGILKNVNLNIAKGDFIGIIGASGSGKSTLVDLIMGLFYPTGGSISVDGKNINQNFNSWQNIIGYVPQNIFLTNDSIKNNIAFGLEKNEINNQNLTKALKDSQLDRFVKSLDLGIETKVGERGTQISGGQLQRIGIARALYKIPEILIFDESTASLDTSTENGILDSIRRLKGEKTILMISHRFSSLKDCDKIFEIKNGKIVVEKTKIK